MASQAQQVFYFDDVIWNGNWKVVQKIVGKNVYDVLHVRTYNHKDEEPAKAYQDNKSLCMYPTPETLGPNYVPLCSENVPTLIVDASTIPEHWQTTDFIDFINDENWEDEEDDFLTKNDSNIDSDSDDGMQAM